MSATPSICYNDREARWAKRYHERRYRQRNYVNANVSNHEVVNVTVPADVERRHAHAPCFCCESRGPCKHRPWA